MTLLRPTLSREAGARPTLSVCLIARDEERLLPGCLASVRPIADEIVLVDTGSTDRTRQLAAESGAVVLERPWDDDFAAPRTLAASHAKSRFILQIDADERLHEASIRPLREALRRDDFEIGLVRMHDAARMDAPLSDVVRGDARARPTYSVPRLLRNSGELRYAGVIHEDVTESILLAGGRPRALEVDLVHFGYHATLQQDRGKRARNVRLLRARMMAEPKSVVAYAYLATELLASGEAAEAKAIAARGWELAPLQPRTRSLRRIGILRGMFARSELDSERMREVARVSRQQEGEHPDLLFLEGLADQLDALRASDRSERARLLGESERKLSAASDLLARGLAYQVLLLSGDGAAELQLGVTLLLAGRPREALQRFLAVLDRGPANELARIGAAEALLDLGEAAHALRMVEGGLGSRPDGWQVAARVALALGATQDAAAFFREATQRAGGGYDSVHRIAHHEALARVFGGAGA